MQVKLTDYDNLPRRIFRGDEATLYGYFAEFNSEYYDGKIERITKEQYEFYKRIGIKETGWYKERDNQ